MMCSAITSGLALSAGTITKQFDPRQRVCAARSYAPWSLPSSCGPLLAERPTLIPPLTPRNHHFTTLHELDIPFNIRHHLSEQLEWFATVYTDSFVPRDLVSDLLLEDLHANTELEPGYEKLHYKRLGKAVAAGYPSYETLAAQLRGNRVATVPLPGGVTVVFSSTGQIGETLTLTLLRSAKAEGGDGAATAGRPDDDAAGQTSALGAAAQPAAGPKAGLESESGSGSGLGDTSRPGTAALQLQVYTAAQLPLNKTIWEIRAREHRVAPPPAMTAGGRVAPGVAGGVAGGAGPSISPRGGDAAAAALGGAGGGGVLRPTSWQLAGLPAAGQEAAASEGDAAVWVAVRSNYRIDVLLAYQVDATDWRSWRLEWRCSHATDRLTAALTWNPHLPELSYMLADGSVWIASTHAAAGGAVAALRRLEVRPVLRPMPPAARVGWGPLPPRPPLEGVAEGQPVALLPLEGRLCVAYGPHPRTLLVARGKHLLRVDLKPPGQKHKCSLLLFLAAKDGNFWSLLTGASRSNVQLAAAPQLAIHLAVAATERQVLFLDIRRPAAPVLLACQHSLPRGQLPSLAELWFGHWNSDGGDGGGSSGCGGDDGNTGGDGAHGAGGGLGTGPEPPPYGQRRSGRRSAAAAAGPVEDGGLTGGGGGGGGLGAYGASQPVAFPQSQHADFNPLGAYGAPGVADAPNYARRNYGSMDVRRWYDAFVDVWHTHRLNPARLDDLSAGQQPQAENQQARDPQPQLQRARTSSQHPHLVTPGEGAATSFAFSQRHSQARAPQPAAAAVANDLPGFGAPPAGGRCDRVGGQRAAPGSLHVVCLLANERVGDVMCVEAVLEDAPISMQVVTPALMLPEEEELDIAKVRQVPLPYIELSTPQQDYVPAGLKPATLQPVAASQSNAAAAASNVGHHKAGSSAGGDRGSGGAAAANSLPALGGRRLPTLASASWRPSCLGHRHLLGLPYPPCRPLRKELGEQLCTTLAGARSRLYPAVGQGDINAGRYGRPALAPMEFGHSSRRSPDLAGLSLALVAPQLLDGSLPASCASRPSTVAFKPEGPPLLLLRLSYDGDLVIQTVRRLVAKSSLPTAQPVPVVAKAPSTDSNDTAAVEAFADAPAAPGGGDGRSVRQPCQSAPSLTMGGGSAGGAKVAPGEATAGVVGPENVVEVLESPLIFADLTRRLEPGTYEPLLKAYPTALQARLATHHLPAAGWLPSGRQVGLAAAGFQKVLKETPVASNLRYPMHFLHFSSLMRYDNSVAAASKDIAVKDASGAGGVLGIAVRKRRRTTAGNWGGDEDGDEQDGEETGEEGRGWKSAVRLLPNGRSGGCTQKCDGTLGVVEDMDIDTDDHNRNHNRDRVSCGGGSGARERAVGADRTVAHGPNDGSNCVESRGEGGSGSSTTTISSYSSDGDAGFVQQSGLEPELQPGGSRLEGPDAGMGPDPGAPKFGTPAFLQTQEAGGHMALEPHQQRGRRRRALKRWHDLHNPAIRPFVRFDSRGTAIVQPRRLRRLPDGVVSLLRAGQATEGAEAAEAKAAKAKAAGTEEEGTTGMEVDGEGKAEAEATAGGASTSPPPPPELSYAAKVVREAVWQRLQAARYPLLVRELMQASVDAASIPVYLPKYGSAFSMVRQVHIPLQRLRKLATQRMGFTLQRILSVVAPQLGAWVSGNSPQSELLINPPDEDVGLWELEQQEIALMAVEVGKLAAASGKGPQAAAQPPRVVLRSLGHVVPADMAARLDARVTIVPDVPSAGPPPRPTVATTMRKMTRKTVAAAAAWPQFHRSVGAIGRLQIGGRQRGGEGAEGDIIATTAAAAIATAEGDVGGVDNDDRDNDDIVGYLQSLVTYQPDQFCAGVSVLVPKPEGPVLNARIRRPRRPLLRIFTQLPDLQARAVAKNGRRFFRYLTRRGHRLPQTPAPAAPGARAAVLTTSGASMLESLLIRWRPPGKHRTPRDVDADAVDAAEVAYSVSRAQPRVRYAPRRLAQWAAELRPWPAEAVDEPPPLDTELAQPWQTVDGVRTYKPSRGRFGSRHRKWARIAKHPSETKFPRPEYPQVGRPTADAAAAGPLIAEAPSELLSGEEAGSEREEDAAGQAGEDGYHGSEPSWPLGPFPGLAGAVPRRRRGTAAAPTAAAGPAAANPQAMATAATGTAGGVPMPPSQAAPETQQLHHGTQPYAVPYLDHGTQPHLGSQDVTGWAAYPGSQAYSDWQAYGGAREPLGSEGPAGSPAGGPSSQPGQVTAPRDGSRSNLVRRIALLQRKKMKAARAGGHTEGF